MAGRVENIYVLALDRNLLTLDLVCLFIVSANL